MNGLQNPASKEAWHQSAPPSPSSLPSIPAAARIAWPMLEADKEDTCSASLMAETADRRPAKSISSLAATTTPSERSLIAMFDTIPMRAPP